MQKSSKIYIAGHTGLVGSAILNKLETLNYTNIITKTHSELDLTNNSLVEKFFKQHQPEYIFLAAATVGGIYANENYPAEFIYNNLSIQSNIIHNAYLHNAKKLIFFGSNCMYPRLCNQPMKEQDILTGPLEPTNSAYAIAKLAGLRMCLAYNKQYNTQYLCVIPACIYGPNDSYNSKNSHVLPALMQKIHVAKINNSPTVEIWGTGEPKREFLYSSDLADACIYLINNINPQEITSAINIGYGDDYKIIELAHIIANTIGYQGKFIFDTSKKDGMPRKLLDSNLITQLGWRPSTSIEHGLKLMYNDFLKNNSKEIII